VPFVTSDPHEQSLQVIRHLGDAVSAFEAGRYAETLQMLEAVFSAGIALPGMHSLLTRCLEKVGRWVEAYTILAKENEEGRADEPMRRRLFDLTMELADETEKLLGERNFQQALAITSMLVELGCDFPGFFSLHGRGLAGCGREQESQRYFARETMLYPHLANAGQFK
jgi:hypothetical protein